MRLLRRPHSQERGIDLAGSMADNVSADGRGGVLETLSFQVHGPVYRYTVAMTPDEWADLKLRVDSIQARFG